MIELRVRNKVSKEELDSKIGKVMPDEDVSVQLTGPTFLKKANGDPLMIYLPQAIPEEMAEIARPILRTVKATSTTRGNAGGGKVNYQRETAKISDARGAGNPVKMQQIGSMEKLAGNVGYPVCRLTAWTGKNAERFRELYPYFQFIGDKMREYVPDRYSAQMSVVRKTEPEWVLPNTPFTTVTVNNTYPTGVHVDKGDLGEGFSCLSVLRKGDYKGAIFHLAEYKIGVNLQDRDLILMDAHEWHGNTELIRESDDAERISVVLYYRTKIAECGTATEEEKAMLSMWDERVGFGEGD